MLTQITFSPVFHIPMTKKQVDRFMRQSDAHYDGVCKAASKVGGFIYGWKNLVDFRDECVVSMSYREFDILSKIMENVGVLSESEKIDQINLRHALMNMYQVYVQKIESMTIEIELNPVVPTHGVMIENGERLEYLRNEFGQIVNEKIGLDGRPLFSHGPTRLTVNAG